MYWIFKSSMVAKKKKKKQIKKKEQLQQKSHNKNQDSPTEQLLNILLLYRGSGLYNCRDIRLRSARLGSGYIEKIRDHLGHV